MFEALVNAIACQQISLQAGLTLLNRLVAAYGRAAEASAPEAKAFPAPDVIAAVDPHALTAIGFSRAKSLAIKEIAASAANGHIGYAAFADLDDSTALATLDKLRGVGRWTAEYALLRGCGRLNIFPGDDVGARNNLQRWLGKRSPLDYGRTRTVLRRWQPYAGLVYLHLLLKHLNDEGVLTTAEP
jgi:DNA-3-methyladenine glycosylase II